MLGTAFILPRRFFPPRGRLFPLLGNGGIPVVTYSDPLRGSNVATPYFPSIFPPANLLPMPDLAAYLTHTANTLLATKRAKPPISSPIFFGFPEVVRQLRINTDNSHHRYDVIILINGVPCVQIELKTLGIQPRRAMRQSVDYKNDPDNGYTKTLLCFLQLSIVSNRDSTYDVANKNARHIAFNADDLVNNARLSAGEMELSLVA